MPGRIMQAKAMIKEPLPALLEPPSHTKTSAIHPTSYRGPLLLWDSFESEARNNLNSTQWSKATICFAAAGTPGPCNAAENEQIYCGAEGSIEGRIQSNIGAVMSAVCRAQGVNLVFGDYAATKDAVTGKEAPDLLIMTRDGLGRAIGEGKVPWVVPAHDLDATVRKGGSDLRRLLGQLARYLCIAGLRYGFMITYEQVIFVKQEFYNNQWTLFYSRPIRACATFDENAGAGLPGVTLRECFWYLLCLIDRDHRANNSTPIRNWVRKT
ncbi:hypothetical protein ASPSYDRAFT_132732 [Aspergillus sydowii CBS 593.65]|uniref:Uncharacterized protein n=1 Tax=Aspergillus sydowii CBS 593.65 TaxID=1036612 RepID=A0A1L9TID0_9EURO|nr:uncharacterized protein ASPSYDRAFT_132732 [Aspergillus sydowii CBS 593.65]OJJ59187.1 hypothetical protein ASPSYDRAFT_132732 [Aspergillus sydowii CBS 593.65]